VSAGLLVAGIGNILLSDDGFGSEVARCLAEVQMPDGVRVADFGIRGVHLAFELLQGYDALILVDAMERGEEAGTITLLRPDNGDTAGSVALDAHDMDPAAVLDMVRRLGGQVGSVVVVGCEPGSLEEGIGLTDPVAEAVAPAVAVVRELVTSYLDPDGGGRPWTASTHIARDPDARER